MVHKLGPSHLPFEEGVEVDALDRRNHPTNQSEAVFRSAGLAGVHLPDQEHSDLGHVEQVLGHPGSFRRRGGGGTKKAEKTRRKDEETRSLEQYNQVHDDIVGLNKFGLNKAKKIGSSQLKPGTTECSTIMRNQMLTKHIIIAVR